MAYHINIIRWYLSHIKESIFLILLKNNANALLTTIVLLWLLRLHDYYDYMITTIVIYSISLYVQGRQMKCLFNGVSLVLNGIYAILHNLKKPFSNKQVRAFPMLVLYCWYKYKVIKIFSLSSFVFLFKKDFLIFYGTYTCQAPSVFLKNWYTMVKGMPL